VKTSRAVALAIALSAVPAAAQNPAADEAFARFWAAATPADAAARVDDVARSGVSFDEAYRRLQRGRPYGPQSAGLVRLVNTTNDGVAHHYVVEVPPAYDPARSWQVRFQLHGGVMMRHDSVPPASAGGVGALAGAEQIYVVPFAWDRSPWWSEDQLLNLREILDAVKRRYNVDENRVVLSGVSDGGTGAYYVAMRETTPFASFLPLNGYHVVLANPDLDVDGPLYPGNLRNKPLFVVNGERDPLYPTSRVDPQIELFKQSGVVVDYRPQAGAGHNTRWWPEVRDAFEAFVRAHPRRPLPDTLTWETADAAHNRAHWLVIDMLGAVADEATGLPDPNMVPSPPRLELGVRSVGNRINRVLPGSNAARLGLLAGDAIVRLNDESVHVAVDVEELFADVKPGARITLLVARANAPVELSGIYDPARVVDPPHALFDRSRLSGRVDLERRGNLVSATTRGVAAFTLLLSPDQFDFDRPVKVVANGRTVFDGRVRKDLRTLLKWAAIDNDRTMLFATELHVDLAQKR
jgi:predicted esterase